MQKITDIIKCVYAFLKSVYVWLFGAADEPTFLRRTFGKAAEWVVVGFVVVMFLVLASNAKHTATSHLVSSSSPVSLCPSPAAPAHKITPKTVKKAS